MELAPTSLRFAECHFQDGKCLSGDEVTHDIEVMASVSQ
jgi:hypothetical protein